MKKTILLAALSLMLAASSVSAQGVQVIADGTPVSFDTPPTVVNDRVMIPLRAVGEALGAAVTWDEETQSANVYRHGTVQTVTIGSQQATIYREGASAAVTMDTAPYTVNDRTMVPARFLAEGFGAQVDWDEDSQTVTITPKQQTVMTVNGFNITEGLFNYALSANMSKLMQKNAQRELTQAEIEELLRQAVTETEEALTQTFAPQSTAQKEGITVSTEDLLATLGASSESAIEQTANILLPYGICRHEFSDLLQAQTASNLLFQTICDRLTTEQLKDFYEKNYITAKHILLTTANLTPEKQAEKKAVAEQIAKQLKQGASFDSLMKEYSEDPGLAQFPDGYTFTAGEMVSEFETAAFALSENQISPVIETSYGYHIIQRLPLEKKTEQELEELRTTMAQQEMMKLVDQADVTLNQTFLQSLNLWERYLISATVAQAANQ